MSAAQEAKAYDLVKQAEKRLASWLNLSGNKYDDAAELYSKAANLFKVSKNWSEAGKAFEQVAQCHLKLKSAHEAATAYSDAANCYKKTDSAHAVLLYKEAVVRQKAPSGSAGRWLISSAPRAHRAYRLISAVSRPRPSCRRRLGSCVRRRAT